MSKTPYSGEGRSLLVYGSGGHGKVVADAARASGWEVVGFADDDAQKRGKTIMGLEVAAIGVEEAAALCGERNALAIAAVGDNRLRERMFSALHAAGVEMAIVVHPRATVSPSVVLGAGTVAIAGAVINPLARVGKNVIINTAATLDHDNVVGDHAHAAPGAHTGGTVTLGPGVFLGIGSSVRNNRSVGEWSVIGMGAAVVDDIPDHVVAFGNPARVQWPLPDTPLEE